MSWQPPPQNQGGWGPPPPGNGAAPQQRRQQANGGQAQAQWGAGAPAAPPPQQQQPPSSPYGYGGPPPPPAYGQQAYGGPPPAAQGGWGGQQQAPPPSYQQQPASAASAAAAAAAAAALGAALGGGGSATNPSDPYQFAAGLAADALRAGAAPGGMLEKAGALFKGGWGALAKGGGGGSAGGSADGGSGGRVGSPGEAYSSSTSGGRGAGGWFGAGQALHVSTRYATSKLALLATPWARRWSYTRTREAGAGGGGGGGGAGGPYAPPARDVSAPDLYLPLMAALTLALLRGVAAVAAGRFAPDTLAAAVSAVFTAWALHAGVLKGALWALGASAAAPLAEVVAYAGYPAVHGSAACAVRAASDWRVVQGRLAAGGGAASLAGGAGAAAGGPPAGSSASAAVAASGGWLPAAVTAYGACASGVFLVRSLKRVLFQDGGGRAGGGRASSPSSNYVLLAVWAAQWPLVWWMARGCRIPAPP